MNEYADDFYEYSFDILKETINKFLFCMKEISKNDTKELNKYNEYIEFISDRNNAYKYVREIPEYLKFINIENFGELSKSNAKQPKFDIFGCVGDVVSVGVSYSNGNCTEASVKAYNLAEKLKAHIKNKNEANKKNTLDLIDKVFEYTKLGDTVAEKFYNITNDIINKKDKLEKLCEEISNKFEYFEPLVADFDFREKHCQDTLSQYVDLVNQIFELIKQTLGDKLCVADKT